MDASTQPPTPNSPSCSLTSRTIHIEFPHHSSSLLESLNRHRLEGKFCDVSLLVQGREIRAHKAVLAAASPYFHDKLLLGDAPRLTLPSVIEADAFEGLLQLIYSGRLRLPLDALPAHLLVASGLQMWQVVNQCSEILRELETSGGGNSGGGGAACHTLLSTTPSGGWCIRSSSFQNPAQSSTSTENSAFAENLVGGEKSELEEVLQIQVKEEEEEQGSAAHLFQIQPQRLPEEFPPACGSHPLPASAFPSMPPEDQSSTLELPAPPVQASHVIEVDLEPLMSVEKKTSGSRTMPRGAKEKTRALSEADSEGKGELRYLLSSEGGETSGSGDPSWKPVDLHGNEIMSGGPGGSGQAVHGPVKLGGTPPADGKCFACLCGKRFAVKPKRDRHIMLTFSLRPFGCGVCNKRFKLKHHLTEHMRTHAKALDACPHCGRRFRVHAFYLRHRDLCKGQGSGTAHWTYK